MTDNTTPNNDEPITETGGGLNPCRGAGAAGFGPVQGGSRRWSRQGSATCPWCGKRIQITQQGRLRNHGTRRPGGAK